MTQSVKETFLDDVDQLMPILGVNTAQNGYL